MATSVKGIDFDFSTIISDNTSIISDYIANLKAGGNLKVSDWKIADFNLAKYEPVSIGTNFGIEVDLIFEYDIDTHSVLEVCKISEKTKRIVRSFNLNTVQGIFDLIEAMNLQQKTIEAERMKNS